MSPKDDEKEDVLDKDGEAEPDQDLKKWPLSCPLCGFRVLELLMIKKGKGHNEDRFFVRCGDCRASTHASESPAKAIRLWNARPKPHASTKVSGDRVFDSTGKEIVVWKSVENV